MWEISFLPQPPTKKYKKIDIKKGKNKWLMMTDGCLFSLVVLQWPGQRHRCASSGLCEQVTAEETAPTTTNTYVMLFCDEMLSHCVNLWKVGGLLHFIFYSFICFLFTYFLILLCMCIGCYAALLYSHMKF